MRIIDVNTIQSVFSDIPISGYNLIVDKGEGYETYDVVSKALLSVNNRVVNAVCIVTGEGIEYCELENEFLINYSEYRTKMILTDKNPLSFKLYAKHILTTDRFEYAPFTEL